MFSFIATALLVVHAAFIAFVVVGGLLLLRWPRLAWLHLPAVAWGAAVELGGWACPLTHWENQARQLAGGMPYAEGFLADHLMRLIYPAGLTPAMQTALGVAVLAINVPLYAFRWKGRRSRAGNGGAGVSHSRRAR